MAQLATSHIVYALFWPSFENVENVRLVYSTSETNVKDSGTHHIRNR